MNTAEAILVEASSSVEALSRAVDIEGKFLHFSMEALIKFPNCKWNQMKKWNVSLYIDSI